MRIQIGDHVLCRGTQYAEYPSEFQITGQREVQITTTLRAAHAKAYDRGNLRTTVTFRVIRQHGDAHQAARYVLTHASTLQGLEGHLTLVVPSGGVDTPYYLHHACVRSVESYYEGICSHHRYTILGGLLTTQAPDGSGVPFPNSGMAEDPVTESTAAVVMDSARELCAC